MNCSSARLATLAVLLAAPSCIAPAGEVGALPEEGSGSAETGEATSGETTDTDTDATASDTDDSATGPGTAPMGACEDGMGFGCCDDADVDGVPVGDDNAPNHRNPDQGDMDGDGIGDVLDLCPTLDSDENNLADSDSDGIGNACDRCARPTAEYNAEIEGSVPVPYLTRNIPTNADADGDGVGDACDNCVVTPNCAGFGGDTPHEIGDPFEYDEALCQTDSDGNGIGDACEGQELPGSAGPVGFAAEQDFDQDGLANLVDTCPRLPLPARVECTDGGGECPPDAACTEGVCNHIDTDLDGVGDACDTCPTSLNSHQVEAGGKVEDDPDGDFVGRACETAPACNDINAPEPHGFYPLSALGQCCVQLLERDAASGDLYLAQTCTAAPFDPADCQPLLAPDPTTPGNYVPVRTQDACSGADEDAGRCRALPQQVGDRPGVLSLPRLCDEALEAAGQTALQNLLSPVTTGAIYDAMCALPPVDLDFDGIGDACDTCPGAFDPEGISYVDESGQAWPSDGHYCNGDYAACE